MHCICLTYKSSFCVSSRGLVTRTPKWPAEISPTRPLCCWRLATCSTTSSKSPTTTVLLLAKMHYTIIFFLQTSSFTIFNSCLVAFNCSQLFETRSNDQRSCPQNHCWRKGTTDVYLTILKKVIEPFYFISQLGLITEHDFKSKTIIGLKFIPLLCPIGYCLISRKIFSIPLEI